MVVLDQGGVLKYDSVRPYATNTPDMWSSGFLSTILTISSLGPVVGTLGSVRHGVDHELYGSPLWDTYDTFRLWYVPDEARQMARTPDLASALGFPRER